MSKRLDGYHRDYTGNLKNPLTEKQEAIIECIRKKYGDKIIPTLKNSSEGWKYIKHFEEYIHEENGVWEIDDLDVSNIVSVKVVSGEILFEVEDLFEDAIKPIPAEEDEELEYWKFVEEAEEKYWEMQCSEYLNRYEPGDDFEEDYIRGLE